MKKKTYLIISFIILICINACTGYKPIFSSPNIKFKIADYSVEGDNKLGNQIYSKLNNLTIINKDQAGVQSIYISIKVLKQKKATVKDSTGKILEYKINLNTQVIVNNYLNDDQLLNHSFDYTSSYKVQDQYSETIKLENKSLDDLINKTYQDLLIKLSENI